MASRREIVQIREDFTGVFETLKDLASLVDGIKNNELLQVKLGSEVKTLAMQLERLGTSTIRALE